MKRETSVDLLALAAGALFAAGLALSGMTNPSKVLGFLDLGGSWDPSLGCVMGGALAVHSLAVRWQRRQARRTGHRKRPQPAGGDQVEHRQRCDELKVVGAADQVADGARQRLIRHMGRAHTRLQLEELACQVRRRSEPTGRERVLVRLAFQERDQLGAEGGWPGCLRRFSERFAA